MFLYMIMFMKEEINNKNIINNSNNNNKNIKWKH